MYNKIICLVFGFAIVFDFALCLKDFPGCCNLEYPTACPYSTSSWQTTTTGNFPDLTNYPGFSWGSNYFWMQDTNGILDFSELHSVNEFTVFSADYYFNPSEVNTGNYLHFFFINAEYPQQKVLLNSVTLKADGWLHVDMPCNSSKTNYCCGSPASLPCTGTIEVIGALPSQPPSLYAVDNVGTCQGQPPSTSTSEFPTTITTTVKTSVASTTTVPITVTPSTTEATAPPKTTVTTEATTTTHSPSVPECCDFDSGTCGWSVSEWTLSSDAEPTNPPPEYDGTYVWTTNNAAKMLSEEMYGITESTVFSAMYYFEAGGTGNDDIIVGFQEDNGVQNIQALLTYKGSNWTLATFDCSPQPVYGSPGCCSSYPCNGKRFIEAAITTAELLYAIDDVGFNEICEY